MRTKPRLGNQRPTGLAFTGQVDHNRNRHPVRMVRPWLTPRPPRPTKESTRTPKAAWRPPGISYGMPGYSGSSPRPKPARAGPCRASTPCMTRSRRPGRHTAIWPPACRQPCASATNASTRRRCGGPGRRVGPRSSTTTIDPPVAQPPHVWILRTRDLLPTAGICPAA